MYIEWTLLLYSRLECLHIWEFWSWRTGMEMKGGYNAIEKFSTCTPKRTITWMILAWYINNNKFFTSIPPDPLVKTLVLQSVLNQETWCTQSSPSRSDIQHHLTLHHYHHHLIQHHQKHRLDPNPLLRVVKIATANIFGRLKEKTYW